MKDLDRSIRRYFDDLAEQLPAPIAGHPITVTPLAARRRVLPVVVAAVAASILVVVLLLWPAARPDARRVHTLNPAPVPGGSTVPDTAHPRPAPTTTRPGRGPASTTGPLPTQPLPVVAPPTSVAAATTTPTTTPPIVTLGMAGWRTAGFGEAEPSELNTNGDAVSSVIDIRWTSWGGPQADGTATALYVAPGQVMAQGHAESARIAAFDLGTCGGHPAYRRYAIWFPQHGQTLGGVLSANPPSFDYCTWKTTTP